MATRERNVVGKFFEIYPWLSNKSGTKTNLIYLICAENGRRWEQQFSPRALKVVLNSLNSRRASSRGIFTSPTRAMLQTNRQISAANVINIHHPSIHTFIRPSVHSFIHSLIKQHHNSQHEYNNEREKNKTSLHKTKLLRNKNMITKTFRKHIHRVSKNKQN